jgi:hypothetical protein
MAANWGAQESTPKRDPTSLEMGSEGSGMDAQFHSLNESA